MRPKNKLQHMIKSILCLWPGTPNHWPHMHSLQAQCLLQRIIQLLGGPTHEIGNVLADHETKHTVWWGHQWSIQALPHIPTIVYWHLSHFNADPTIIYSRIESQSFIKSFNLESLNSWVRVIWLELDLSNLYSTPYLSYSPFSLTDVLSVWPILIRMSFSDKSESSIAPAARCRVCGAH